MTDAASAGSSLTAPSRLAAQKRIRSQERWRSRSRLVEDMSVLVSLHHVTRYLYDRPVGLAQGPDGALYLSDDKGGRIWKITYSQQRK